jgi:hypothetical protein
MSLERQRCVLRVDLLGVHKVYKRILLQIEYGGMGFGPLVRLLASQSEFPDGLPLAVSLSHEAGVIYPAVAGHFIPVDFDKICVVDQVEDR